MNSWNTKNIGVSIQFSLFSNTNQDLKKRVQKNWSGKLTRFHNLILYLPEAASLSNPDTYCDLATSQLFQVNPGPEEETVATYSAVCEN